jgi:hypothetical protein
MALTLINALAVLTGIYLAAGIVFAIRFVARRVGRMDPGAREGTRGFRVLIFPGVVAWWPLFAWRLSNGATHPPDERNVHRLAAQPGNNPKPPV